MVRFVWNPKKGLFYFETRLIKGTLVPTGKLHGVHRLVYRENGFDWRGTYPGDLPAYGIRRGDKLFFLNVYHLLAESLPAGKVTGRALEQEYNVINNGVELILKPSKLCPVTHRLRYEIKEPDIIDLTVSVTPHRCLRAYEVWISSYITSRAVPYIYVYNNPARKDLRKERFVPVLENEFIRDWWGGGYVFFPRDNVAARIIYDGRWGLKYQPFITGPYYAKPLIVNLNERSGVALILMADLEACPAVYTSWIRTSMKERANTAEYFALFGANLEPGKTKTAKMRMCLREIDRDFDLPLKLYMDFVRMH
ncbi:hypothetical protein CW702_01640 [Candidatus Bathyarchaeota archaeon]|nr:MAG: hypothetical protein CW702_01640 [Candidatus Bathyarchaeota archaeon]